MSGAGKLRRRVTFKRRAVDINGDRLGDYADIVTRVARVQPLDASEAVQQQRVQGLEPVNIFIRRDGTTKLIDNSYEAEDFRDPTVGWDIQWASITEDLVWVKIRGLQRKGQAVP